jgi:hypothetical protein
MGLQEIGVEGVDYICLDWETFQARALAKCEHCNEPSGSMKRETHLNHSSDYWLLKKYFVPESVSEFSTAQATDQTTEVRCR